MNPIFPTISVLASCDYNHQVRFPKWCLMGAGIRGPYQITDPQEVCCSLINLMASKFAFDKGKSSILKMDDEIRLEAIAVPIIRETSINGACIHPEVACDKTFEHEAESPHILEQGLWSEAEGGTGQ